MCQAFSCLVGMNRKVTWKLGVDSHSELVRLAGYKDDERDPALLEFARVEITPDNNNYIAPDNWTLRVDEQIRPAWFNQKHEEACHAAHKKWLAKLDKILVRKAIAHPFKIAPPAEITKKHITLLRNWASVRASVWDSVWASVWAASVGTSVWDSVWASVWAASVGTSVWDSVRDSVGAYVGSFFSLPKWKYIKHPKGRYPFGPAVKLWETGLVPSFDGTTWRLHGGPKAAVLYQISAEELRGR